MPPKKKTAAEQKEEANLAAALAMSLAEVQPEVEPVPVPESPLSGVEYTAAFNVENFLKTNVPNAHLRCYANSTTQLIRQIPEFFAAQAPLILDTAELPAIGPLEFYRFLHRNMHITNLDQFNAKYLNVINALLGSIGCPLGQQDQNEFFNKLISYGSRQLPRPAEMMDAKRAQRQVILDAAIAANNGSPLLAWDRAQAKENVDNVARETTYTEPGPFFQALIPHIGIKTVTRKTLTVDDECEEFTDINTEGGEEDQGLYLTVKASNFAADTPIQDFFNPGTISEGVPSTILRKMIANPKCHDFIKEYIAITARREEIDRDLSLIRPAVARLVEVEAALTIAKAAAKTAILTEIFGDKKRGEFDKAKPDTYSDELYDWLQTEQTTRKKAKDARPVTFEQWLDTKPDKKEKYTKKDETIAAATAEMQSEIEGLSAIVSQRPALQQEGRAISEQLLKPVHNALLFKKSSKYLLLYINYFFVDPETQMVSRFAHETRFANILSPIAIPMVDGTKRMYEPISIVMHSGTQIVAGHYYTYNYIDEKAGWYKFDDSLGAGGTAVPTEVDAIAIETLVEETQPTFILYRMIEAAAAGGAGAPKSKGGVREKRRLSRKLKAMARRTRVRKSR